MPKGTARGAEKGGRGRRALGRKLEGEEKRLLELVERSAGRRLRAADRNLKKIEKKLQDVTESVCEGEEPAADMKALQALQVAWNREWKTAVADLAMRKTKEQQTKAKGATTPQGERAKFLKRLEAAADSGRVPKAGP